MKQISPQRQRFIWSFLLLLLPLLLLASCQAETGGDLSGGGRVIVDQLGRTVELPKTIEMVCASHIYGGKMLFAMGQKEKIAFQMQLGADTEALAVIDKDYGALPTALTSAQGTNNPEGLLALGVNLVFTYAGQGAETAEMYQNAGIAAIAVSGETFDEVYETARIMGEVFECPERAEEVIDFIEDLRGIVSGRLAGLTDKDKPVVLVCGNGGVYTAATADMFQHQMIETAGGINAGAALEGTWANTSAEDIILWDPDYIVLGSSYGVTVESVLAESALQPVKAVQEKGVYLFPSTLGWWDFPLPQSILGIVWMAKTIHPEYFEDVDMLEMADRVYKLIYGYTYTELGGAL